MLRDALSTCSRTRSSTGRWSTAQGRVVGVLSIELLSHVIARTPPEDVPTSVELA